MDALDLLKNDHERIRALILDFQNTTARQQKRIVYDNIRDDLELHLYIEESILYPAFEKFDECRALIQRARVEHGNVKRVLLDLRGAGPLQGEAFDSKFLLLEQEVLSHLDEEEHRLFPVLRKIMKRPERERMGRLLQAAKQEQEIAA